MLQTVGYREILTKVEGEAGHVIKQVPVELTYVVDTDSDYAESERPSHIVIFDIAIDPEHLSDLNLTQVEQLIESARAQLTQHIVGRASCTTTHRV